MIKEIKGDLLKLAKAGEFDMIIHGCNCFCKMGSGIAKQIKEQFPKAYEVDQETKEGDINKLGTYTLAQVTPYGHPMLFIVNAYTQYRYGTDKVQVDYEALTLVMRKINHDNSGIRIGLPLIGAGLAGGDWNRIKKIIETEFTKNKVTIVHYSKEPEDRFSKFAGTSLFPNT